MITSLIIPWITEQVLDLPLLQNLNWNILWKPVTFQTVFKRIDI